MIDLKKLKGFFFSQQQSQIQKTNGHNNHITEYEKNLNCDETQQFINTPFHNNRPLRCYNENFYKCLDVHKRPRLVKKSGELNINSANVQKRKRRLFSDMFTTILDTRWRWHFFMFLFTFIISWFGFAFLWYLIAYFNNDLNLTSTNSTDPDHVPCVTSVYDFTSALLYSIETQHTIGYGFRHITEKCNLAIFLLMIQSTFGVFVQGLLAGVVFAKMSRPSKRKRTIIFSHNACVSERDGKLCFMFRIANIRVSQLSDARIKMHMIKSRRTSEGEFIPFQTYDMKVGHDWSGKDNLFFPWPKTVEHVIDEQSPLYELCKKASSHAILNQTKTYAPYNNKRNNKLSEGLSESSGNTETTILSSNDSDKSTKTEDYEIIIILEGNIETTGSACHIRTSYLPQEILFGYRFTPFYPKFTDFEYCFDYSTFDHVEPYKHDLLGLNVAFTNKETNYVVDAINESKNLYQTVQNTEQIMPSKLKKSKDVKNSVFNLLKAFGTYENNQLKKIENRHSRSESVCKNLGQISEANKLKVNHSFSSPELHHGRLPTPEIIVIPSSPPISSEPPIAKTGRFTVQAVKNDRIPMAQITNEVSNQHESSAAYKRLMSNLLKRNLLPIPPQNELVTFSSNSALKRLAFRNHIRANSLPSPKQVKQIGLSNRHSFDNPVEGLKLNSNGTIYC